MRRTNRMMIDLEAVRNVPILRIASDLGIEVKANNKAMCFSGHDNKTPSLSFTPNKNLWYCFGCGKKGGNIDLVKECLKLSDWKEAARWIESQYLQDGNRHRNPIRKRSLPLKPISRNISDVWAPDPSVYEWMLENCRLTSKGVAYLKSRGFSSDTIEYFKIGELDKNRNILDELLRHFPEEQLLKCGLIKTDEKGIRLVWRDDFLLFPFYDRDAVVYLQGRSLSLKPNIPKYINLYGVKKPLFNYTIINTIEVGETVVLVEGVMDAMAGHQLGWNAIGVLGANSFTDEWLNPLSKYRIVVIPDNDAAGNIFISKIRDGFRNVGISVSIVHINGAKDLSEFLQKSIQETTYDE